MNFPNEQYIQALVNHLDAKVKGSQSFEDRLLMLSGASMNWIADFMTDPSVAWSLETLPIDSLVFTGTNPEWNKVLLERADRSPLKLRSLLKQDPSVALLFADVKFTPEPVLVREDQGLLKLLDGSHRVVAAIREGHETIQAYVARMQEGTSRPSVEPHVVYDLLKAYHRGLTPDRAGLVTALRYLRFAYGNVDALLRERFSLIGFQALNCKVLLPKLFRMSKV